MDGLELRIATLKAAGAYVREWSGKPGIYRLILPKTIWGDVSELQFESEADAWTAAPPVESSVDAALKWLVLPTGCYWQLDGPVSDPNTQGSSLAAIVDINSSMERVTVGNPATPEEMKAAIKFNKPLAEATAESLPRAMCEAYRMLKQRG